MQPNTGIRTLQGRIPELDGLRGLAILLVLLLHYVADSRGGDFGTFLYRFKNLFKLGWSGVDLFFVLSGFLIGSILLDARNSPRYFQTFYLRRVHRIMPIYYLFVILYGLFALCAAGKLPPPLAVPQLNRWLVPAHLLFLQNIVNFPGNIFHRQCLAALWSLAVEEQFYLGVPLLIHFLSKRNLVRVLMFAV